MNIDHFRLFIRWRFRRVRRNYWRIVTIIELVVNNLDFFFNEFLSLVILHEFFKSNFIFLSFFNFLCLLDNDDRLFLSDLLNLLRTLCVVINFLLRIFIKILLNCRIVSWMTFWLDKWVNFNLLYNFLNFWTHLIALCWINSKSMLWLLFNFRIFWLKISLCCL